jgi:hypothetical protein
MSMDISHETEARLTEEARKQGISVDALVERLLSEGEETTRAAGSSSAPKLPILHLGPMGAFHRRDIYDDVR